ncbi:MAG TPA: IclR family transcriptional regulator [Ktedonobacteraceae bacterium]|nr:IclR family transcriptional regulator [Ktedonobacteraceae bacterium]
MNSTLLDIEREVDYTVRMNEQSVRYGEQNTMSEQHVTTQELPAPMVERAFRLLDLLSVAEEGLTLSDLARSLNMSKSSIHGLLKTLESNEAIEQMEDRRFVLGPRIYDLARTYIQRAGLRHFALPAMHRLATGTGETVCLGRLEPKGVRIIECVEDVGEQAGLHIAVRRGMRIPLLAGATGAFALSTWPLAQRETYLRTHPLTRYTEHSITDPQQFLARVEEVVLAGVSIDREEYLEGVNAVSAPIYGAGGTLVAFLWIVGFSSRFKDEVLDRAAEQLRAEAEAVSQALGARG